MDHAFDIFDQFAADPKLELEGFWSVIGPATRNLEDGQPDPDSAPAILVARSGNKRHGRIVSQLYEASKATLELKNDAADAESERITIESMAKGILLGWKNLTFKKVKMEDGWRIEDAKKLLAVHDFRELVNKKATDFNNYKLKQEEEAAKN